jgi:Protoporphyrinogen oxidase
MKICILGGGLTGLAAAYRLSERHDIDLFEKRNHLGGCLSSYNINGHWIEQYYHHCFAGDTELLSLFKELNISDRLEWLRGSTGYYADNTLYPLTSPLEILRYPFLSLADKARLALFTLRAKKSIPVRSIRFRPGTTLYRTSVRRFMLHFSSRFSGANSGTSVTAYPLHG